MKDLISRQAAIEAIGNDVMGGLNYQRILRELPSAQEQKRGRWINWTQMETLSNYQYHFNAFCSECKEGVKWTSRYCPNCGAEMKKEDGEQDG